MTATKKAEVSVERISRGAAANRVIAEVNGKTTLSQLAQRADELFVEGGGKSGIAAATYDVRKSLEAGEALGIFKLTRPTDVLVERITKK